jgi:hypothetical protein
MPGLRGMGDQAREVEGHLLPRIRPPEGRPIQVHLQDAVELRAVPSRQVVHRHRHRRTGAGGFRLDEAEALGEFARDEVAERDVVQQHHEPDRARGFLRGGAHPDGASDDRDLRFEVDAPGGVAHDVVGGPEKPVRPALVHQRIGPERRRHLRPPCAPDKLHVVHISRSVEELERAGQGGGAAFRTERFRRARRRDRITVERVLQPALLRRPADREVARNDHQPPVRRSVLQRRDLHASDLIRFISAQRLRG